MRIPKLIKSQLKNVPMLAVLAAISIGMFIGRELYRLPVDSQPVIPTQLPTEPGSITPLHVPGVTSSCDFGLVFASLPPKCKTLDGSFIQANRSWPFVVKVPGAK